MMSELIFENKDISVLVDKDSLEPDEFFQIIKSGSMSFNTDGLKNQLIFLHKQIGKAKVIGQDRFVERATFLAKCLTKEIVLLNAGINEFVLRDALTTFMKKVSPVNSVKVIELSRYPRMIPDNVVEKISSVKELGVFDDYVVVFTDLTKNDYKTEDERKFVERNRDPIVFGIFKEDKSEIHERMYFIADWIDDFCELTFDEVLNEVPSDAHGFISGNIEDVISQYSNIDDAELVVMPVVKERIYSDKLNKRLAIPNPLYKRVWGWIRRNG